MSANGISELATKELRQAAKLALAATKRATDGNARPYYDITQLPTQYDGNDIIDNENAGGLVLGRPWVATDPAPVSPGSMFIANTSSRITLSSGIAVGATSTTPFTVEGWFYSTVTPGTSSGPVLLSTDTSSGTPAYANALTVNVSSATQIVVDSNGAASQAFDFAETMLIDTWYYVAVSRDSSGYIQVWLGKDGDANATASTTGRVSVSGNAAWNLTGLSNCIGAFVPAGRYTKGYISNLRVGTTALYATNAATIPVPTEAFTELASTVFLQNDDTLTDQTGTRTLSAVSIAAGDDFNPFDYSGTVLRGLVLNLDAGNTLSYSGTGTTWTDLSRSGKNATLGSGVGYSETDGGSLSFIGGSLGIATVSSASSITGLLNNMTIEVWYKSQGNVTPRLLSTGIGSDGICFGSHSSNPTKFKVTKYGLVDLFAGSIPQATNAWHQAVLVYSSTGGTKVYVDGALSETLADAQDISASGTPSIIIGKLESAYHKGNISMVRWYNNVLSDAEVLQNYNANIGRYALQPAAVSNLVLYLDPSDYVSYPAAGTTVNNLGATAALSAGFGSVTWVKPYINFASTSQLVVSDNAVLEPGTSNFALEVWVYYSTIAGSSRCIVSKTDNGGLASNWSYGLRTNAEGATYFEVGNGTTSVTSPSFTATTGTWHQIVGVWTNTAPKSIALYKNGELVGSNSHTFASVKNSIRPLYIGSYNGGEYAQWFNGRMGVVRQYNKALSAAEVLQNYNNDRGLYGL